MLDIAIKHKEDLIKKFNDIWFDEKYMYYNYDSYYDAKEIDNTTWNRHEFVSLDKDGNIIGYISYKVNRQCRYAQGFATINFSDNKIIFGMDLGQVLTDIFTKFNFIKLNFSVVIGNPIEKSYDKMIDKYNGRVVGVFKNDTMLIDGSMHDVKHYEIMRDNYLKSIKNSK